MPMYQFRCPCGYEAEYLLEIVERDSTSLKCPKCNQSMRRVPAMPTLGQSKHESKAILGDGRKVSGTWEK